MPRTGGGRMFDPMEFEIDEPEKVVYVVGIGPGDVYYLTQEAQNVWNTQMPSAAINFILI